MNQNHLYFFSGLGADERAFARLKLQADSVNYIHWITPNNDETIADYAKCLTAQINHDNPVLIGLSFGGIMALEAAKLLSAKKIILISSVKHYKEIPWYFRWAGALGLHKLIPEKFITNPVALIYKMFGAKTIQEQKMLNEILLDTDPVFFRWAIDKVVKWKNTETPGAVFQLHGSNDKIFPLRFIKAHYVIEDGSHLMVYNKATEVSELINAILKN